MRIEDLGAAGRVAHRALRHQPRIEPGVLLALARGRASARRARARRNGRRRSRVLAVQLGTQLAAQVLQAIGRRIQQLVVARDDVLGRAAGQALAAVQQQGAVAQLDHRTGRVRHEQHGGAALTHGLQTRIALALEGLVADRQRLVDHQDVRIHVDRHGKRQAHVHAAGIGLHRLLDEFADVGEGGDGIEARLDLRAGQSEHGAVEEDVFPSGELRVEARAELQQGGDAPVHLDPAAARRQRAADDLQQGGLARAVAADDADRLAAPHLEAHFAQGVELAVPGPRVRKQLLQQAVVRLVVDGVALAHALDADGDFRGHRRIPTAWRGTRHARRSRTAGSGRRRRAGPARRAGGPTAPSRAPGR